VLEILPGVFATPERALWIPGERVLAVGDLHLGYESSHRANGAPLPAMQQRHVLDTLLGLCDRFSPETVVLNGDVKHAFRHLLPQSRDVAAVCEALQARAALIVVEGNHDGQIAPMLPEGVTLVKEHLTAGGTWFTHGHLAVAAPAGAVRRVVSHEHPSLGIRDEVGVTFRYPAYLADAATGTVVLPAMSPWASGVDVLGLRRFNGATLARADIGAFRAAAITEAGILAFGTVRKLRNVLRR